MTSARREGGGVIWLTGLSGAGKSTIAEAVDRRLSEEGCSVELLDGDELRAVVPTGFSRPEREDQVKRAGYLASRLEHHGVIVIAAMISPYRASRAFVRDLCKRFVEVHVSTPLEVCEARDPKGLYKRARSGEIRDFTGIDDPYEAPESPDVELDTSALSIDESIEKILQAFARAR